MTMSVPIPRLPTGAVSESTSSNSFSDKRRPRSFSTPAYARRAESIPAHAASRRADSMTSPRLHATASLPCLPCQSARSTSRCDGRRPQCLRCRRQRLECCYDTPARPIVGNDDPRRLEAFQYLSEVIAPADSASPAKLSLHDLSQIRKVEPAVDCFIAALVSVHRTAWDPSYHQDDSRYYYTTLQQGLERFICRSLAMPPELIVWCQEQLAMAEVLRSGDVRRASTSLDAFQNVLWQWSVASNDDGGGIDKVARQRVAQRLLPYHVSTGDTFRETADLIDVFGGRGEMVTPAEVAQRLDPSTVPVFPDLASASTSLEYIISRWLVRILTWKPSAWVRRLDLSLANVFLARWKLSFNRVCHVQPLHASDVALQQALQLHFFTARAVSLRHKVRGQAMADMYGHVSDAYDTILTSMSAHSTTPLRVIPPAFALATLCPDARLRRRGLHILQQLHVTEGAWSSDVAYLVAAALQPILETLAGSTSSPSLVVVVTDAATVLTPYPTAPHPHLSITYSILAQDKKPQSFTTSLDLSDQASVLACKNIQWPLVQTIQSLGYHGQNTQWSPYLMTPGLASDRERLRSMFGRGARML